MQIRRAMPNDFLHMYDLVQQSQITRTSNAESGFLEYPLGFGELSLRATNNPFAFVADDGEIRAFHVSYTRDKLRELCELDSSIARDPITPHIDEETFLYIDVACTNPTYRRQGLFRSLHARTVVEACRLGIPQSYAATAHNPWRNKAIINFLGENGYALRKEISTPTGLHFGLYRRELK